MTTFKLSYITLIFFLLWPVQCFSIVAEDLYPDCKVWQANNYSLNNMKNYDQVIAAQSCYVYMEALEDMGMSGCMQGVANKFPHQAYKASPKALGQAFINHMQNNPEHWKYSVYQTAFWFGRKFSCD